MFDLYIVTGATGFLGNAVIRELLKINARVRALIMEDDPLSTTLPCEVEKTVGRVDDKASLKELFCNTDGYVCVIHCAGIVSIASRTPQNLYTVNVGGTKNITDLCIEHGVSKLVYISSVHALQEAKKGCVTAETNSFSPESVSGDYAKSKALATAYVLNAVKKGLCACVVHPSGIIGPYDRGHGSITEMITSYCLGKMRVAVHGGYDFVDVRDVAHGILSACHSADSGECYILSNRYVSLKELLQTLQQLTHGKKILAYLPLWVAKLAAPLYERHCIKKKKPTYFTPYSVYTLGTNSIFSHQKASHVLGYTPRPVADTLSDTVQ